MTSGPDRLIDISISRWKTTFRQTRRSKRSYHAHEEPARELTFVFLGATPDQLRWHGQDGGDAGDLDP